MKRIISFFTPPKRWQRPVIVLLGMFCGLASYSIYVSKAWSYAFDDPEVCINCHIMTPEYTSWQHSAHRETAVCNDCHVPHQNMFVKYLFKGKDGLRHSTLFTLRAERQVIIIENEGKRVVKENCIRCHEALFDRSKLYTQTEGQYVSHHTDRDCWDCHRGTPHGTVHSLSSSPNSLAPLLNSPLPEWLQQLTED